MHSLLQNNQSVNYILFNYTNSHCWILFTQVNQCVTNFTVKIWNTFNNKQRTEFRTHEPSYIKHSATNRSMSVEETVFPAEHRTCAKQKQDRNVTQHNTENLIKTETKLDV